ncbi:molybdenum cofactor guanylyltransferase [Desulfitobacterium metallireducens]|uniref:Probable molybdenum cofactor guanylyltransferase n=1 Tax=Desulfitobacterium metallireducens DSM 15288 TaxID=871968 RepID=W0E8G4_9FIRM|nr:molybdenum cofactor guanylyltransferase [Desulfitobacterium metallireducens]AHF05803.1 molybdenum cofactor guanylyltransferase [Desulfitobacterium metallireducens DSM 15288]
MLEMKDNILNKSVLPVTGVLLAGGKSSRMGRDKAFLDYLGKPLIEKGLEELRSVFSEVIISTNSPERFQCYGEKKVTDLYPGCGPLSGLQSGLQAAQFGYSFFVACDMPFIDPEVIRFLAGYCGKHDVIVPEVDGVLHPLHAFYHKNCLPLITEYLEKRSFKIIDFYPRCSVRIVREEEFRRFPQVARSLKNANTVQEWQELQTL